MLQFSLKVTVITSRQVNNTLAGQSEYGILYEAALFCHNSSLLIICIYLLHVNGLQCYLFVNLKKSSLFFCIITSV